jgi:hypothetical protein
MTKPTSPADAIKFAVTGVTKDWVKQRKAEERSSRPPSSRSYYLARSSRVTIKEAAERVMEEAYLKASGNGQHPVKPRQIMYAARPKILALTGNDQLDDVYFTQTILTNYLEEFECDDWNIVWDARGSFAEPHTGEHFAVGTLEVHGYLAQHNQHEAAVDVADNSRFPTKGPENRYSAVLYCEKEGFNPLFKSAQLAARYDIAIMSNKGMSVTATRELFDGLVDRGVEQIFCLHDFDISGLSILGTLGTDGRRYTFSNQIPIIDLGLRLADIGGLEDEPRPPSKNSWDKVSATLRRHGATADEIAILRTRRVELNAMSSDQLIKFIEAKFKEHGVKKVIPDNATIESHARRLIEQQKAEKAIEAIRENIAREAAAVKLPANLRQRVAKLLKSKPQLAWDDATLEIIEKIGL